MTAATLEAIAQHIALAVSPLEEHFQSPTTAGKFLGRMLGIDLELTDAELPLLAEIAGEAGTLRIAAQVIAAQRELSDPDIGVLGQKLLAIFSSISRLVELAGDMDVRLREMSVEVPHDTQGPNGVGTRWIAHLLVDYLADNFPLLLSTLELLGLARRKFIVVEGDATRGYVEESFVFDQLGKLVTDPFGLLEEAYAWGMPSGADIELLFKSLVQRGVQKIHPVGAWASPEPRKPRMRGYERVNLLSASVH